MQAFEPLDECTIRPGCQRGTHKFLFRAAGKCELVVGLSFQASSACQSGGWDRSAAIAAAGEWSRLASGPGRLAVVATGGSVAETYC